MSYCLQGDLLLDTLCNQRNFSHLQLYLNIEDEIFPITSIKFSVLVCVFPRFF